MGIGAFFGGLRFCINSVNDAAALQQKRVERKKRKQCKIDQAAKSSFNCYAKYFGPPCTRHGSRLMLALPTRA